MRVVWKSVPSFGKGILGLRLWLWTWLRGIEGGDISEIGEGVRGCLCSFLLWVGGGQFDVMR